MTHHPPVGVIYLRAKSKWPNMFYTVQISIYNKWLQDEEQINDSVIHIMRGMRNGRMERDRKSAIVCVERNCIVWDRLTHMGAQIKQVCHRARHDKHCKLCTLIVKACFWFSRLAGGVLFKGILSSEATVDHHKSKLLLQTHVFLFYFGRSVPDLCITCIGNHYPKCNLCGNPHRPEIKHAEDGQ